MQGLAVVARLEAIEVEHPPSLIEQRAGGEARRSAMKTGRLRRELDTQAIERPHGGEPGISRDSARHDVRRHEIESRSCAARARCEVDIRGNASLEMLSGQRLQIGQLPHAQSQTPAG